MKNPFSFFTKKTSADAAPLVEIFPKKLVIVIGVLCFVIEILLILLGIFKPEMIADGMPRYVFLLATSIYLSVFLFILYPQRIVARSPLWDWSVRLVGPPALLLVLLHSGNAMLPSGGLTEKLKNSGEYHLFFKSQAGGDFIYRDLHEFTLMDRRISAFEEVFRPAGASLTGRLVKSDLEVASGNMILGHISQAAKLFPIEEVEEKLNPETNLRLGLYFASCDPAVKVKGNCRRRDEKKARLRLYSALDGNTPVTELHRDERDEGAKILYQLHEGDELDTCSELKQTIKAIRMYRSSGAYRDHELAEIYLKVSSRPPTDNKRAAEEGAIYHYLSFIDLADDSQRERITESSRRIAVLLRTVAPEHEGRFSNLMKVRDDVDFQDFKSLFKPTEVRCSATAG